MPGAMGLSAAAGRKGSVLLVRFMPGGAAGTVCRLGDTANKLRPVEGAGDPLSSFPADLQPATMHAVTRNGAKRVPNRFP